MAGDGTEELKTGLAVRGADGRRLGTLVGLEAGSLVVERGFFWPQRFTISRSAPLPPRLLDPRTAVYPHRSTTRAMYSPSEDWLMRVAMF